ncbi:hypothetical protein BBO99_00000594 [Phytophthora kernoviae]|uniref:Endo-beta-1,6-galactanase-like domain-containing protein n=2 Tax=Phytophthora kernoviae TaxID=325452 RepID=A0A421F2Z1_9STRA|nr:hypothetical protein G195_001601 [Phytophthora kernoviae 00238/432]RLN20478.1 hypothetical protein BBI17_005489 [Phytophthora kernoviae]RLN85319.1 hypothetical protein BBO99_00000594 [Phytophthora kernoviae]
MLTIQSLAASTLTWALLVVQPSQVTADYTVTTAAGTTLLGAWEGWGTSLCWWANVFGDREDIADALFTLNDAVTLDGATSPIPALGMTIVRYNVGGSSNNVVDDSGTEVAMSASDKMPAFKFMESFWLDWMSKDPTSTSWDWSVDAKQRAMLDLATKRDVDVLEAFSNSPPWWMTNNHATAGGDNGDKDNLQDWNHDEFVLYLSAVVSKAKTSWGINFTYVEPFNEPMSTWWTFPGGQEGCHFEVDTQNDVLVQLRTQLDTLGLQDVAISASDENSPSLALATLTSMSTNTDVMNAIGKVNTHGYDGLSPYRGEDREPLKALVAQSSKKLWDSEYGESDATGLSLAESIGLDINQMGVSAFVYWQALDSGAWGLIQSNPGDSWIGTPNPKYYVMAQYSRHIRPGMAILSTDDVKTVMAYDAAAKLLVLVTVNTGDAQTITFDLASFTRVAGPITAWTTETSGSEAEDSNWIPHIIEFDGTSSTLACVLLMTQPSHVIADYTVKADSATTLLDSWEGWGTSLAWWANAFGNRADIADSLFTLKESVTVEGVAPAVPALGMNIVRYNVGGSGNNVIDDGGTEVAMSVSKNMPATSPKYIDTFWLNWASNDSTSTSWNWKADANQRAMLDLATKRDVDIVEAFSNAPPWWMTNNHATAGGADGKKDNLQSWNHGQFALYLATVVSQAKTSWGIDIKYVEPFNEPMSMWWTFPGGQEGCHFEVNSQKDVLLKLRAKLDALGLKDVVVATSDENTPPLALSTLTTMSKDANVMASFGKVNTHGYAGLSPYRGPDRGPLKDLVKKSGKTLWDSEYGEKDATGLSMAESIALDINEMGVSAFVYWQALDGGGWGLLQSVIGDKAISAPNLKYYVMAQYSRHIRPGMAILSSDDAKSVMAYDATAKLLVLVTVNTGVAQKVTFDLASFKAVKGPISAWTTEANSTDGALYKSSTIKASGTSFDAAFPASSVMTFEIQGVE